MNTERSKGPRCLMADALTQVVDFPHLARNNNAKAHGREDAVLLSHGQYDGKSPLTAHSSPENQPDCTALRRIASPKKARKHRIGSDRVAKKYVHPHLSAMPDKTADGLASECWQERMIQCKWLISRIFLFFYKEYAGEQRQSDRMGREIVIHPVGRLERVTGIEPAWPVWKTGTLPLSYTRSAPP